MAKANNKVEVEVEIKVFNEAAQLLGFSLAGAKVRMALALIDVELAKAGAAMDRLGGTHDEAERDLITNCVARIEQEFETIGRLFDGE
jgi:hypothetical protein